MSFNPSTGLAYIPASDGDWFYRKDQDTGSGMTLPSRKQAKQPFSSYSRTDYVAGVRSIGTFASRARSRADLRPGACVCRVNRARVAYSLSALPVLPAHARTIGSMKALLVDR